MLLPEARGLSSDTVGQGALDGNTAINFNIELEDITQRGNISSSPATIRVRNMTLAWSDENLPVIDDVSLDFHLEV